MTSPTPAELARAREIAVDLGLCDAVGGVLPRPRPGAVKAIAAALAEARGAALEEAAKRMEDRFEPGLAAMIRALKAKP